MLVSQDFPNYYVNMKHPEDYISVKNPIPLECIVHSCEKHVRVIMRISWKIKDEGFLPMSFILDTGAVSDIYLSKEGLAAFEKYNLILRDGRDSRFVRVQIGKYNDQLAKCFIEDTPENYEPANLIGLKLLLRLGLHLNNKAGFEFDHLPLEAACF